MEWFFKNNVAQANCHRSSGGKHETNNTLAPQRRSHYIVSQTTCTCTDTHSWLRKIPAKISCHTVYIWMSRTTRQPFILNPINETPEYKLDMTTDRLSFISHVHQFLGTISH